MTKQKATQETWRDRERERQKSRTMPVWINEPFWTEHADRHADHFAHLSALNPPLLAYTVDESKGERDLQTQIKAGRYLVKYFADVLTAKQIAYLAAWQANGIKPQGEAKNADVQFATTEEQIIDVYARGPRSCMDGEHFDGDDSPVRVYAAGDLAIAYLEGEPPPHRPDNNVIARALVWPAKKVMGRIYPTEGAYITDGWRDSESHMAGTYALETKLREMGYNSVYDGGTFDGAKLQRIKADYGGPIMPYLDNDYCVDATGDYFIMREEGEGEFTCQETNGRLGDEVEQRYDYHCERCDEGNNDGTSTVVISTSRLNGRFRRTVEWCEYCCAHGAFFCEGFQVTFSDDLASVCINGDTFSALYADENFYVSDYSDEYFVPDQDPRVEMENGETWAESEFIEHGFTCKITGENHSKDDEHPDHTGIFADCDGGEIADYLAEQIETMEAAE